MTAPEVWHRKVRAQFPQIVAHPGTAYLDSAATAQKPQAVLDAALSYLTTGNANAGRGTYPWANRTTARIEQARDRVRRFLGAPGGAVHFVSGATEGLRVVARDWLRPRLRPGDQVIVPLADHAANALPWQETGAEIVPMPYDAAHDYDVARLRELIGPRTRLIAATHVHHVYGNDMNVHRIRAAAPGVPICLDAAQSAGHRPIAVDELGVDLLVFSGHKAMALPGTGVLWSRDPSFTPSGWAGTPNTAGIVSLAAALDWLDDTGVDRIAAWTTALGARLTDGLRALPAIEVLGCQDSLAAGSAVQRRLGIVSFRHRGIGAGDLGFILAGEGILVRADGHCQAERGERDSSVRVSLHAYNAPEEIDRLLAVLNDL